MATSFEMTDMNFLQFLLFIDYRLQLWFLCCFFVSLSCAKHIFETAAIKRCVSSVFTLRYRKIRVQSIELSHAANLIYNCGNIYLIGSSIVRCQNKKNRFGTLKQIVKSLTFHLLNIKMFRRKYLDTCEQFFWIRFD